MWVDSTLVQYPKPDPLIFLGGRECCLKMSYKLHWNSTHSQIIHKAALKSGFKSVVSKKVHILYLRRYKPHKMRQTNTSSNKMSFNRSVTFSVQNVKDAFSESKMCFPILAICFSLAWL